MTSVSLQHVEKFFGPRLHAVKDATLEVADREFLVLVGPSGCGKTTILRMIAGLEEATSGEIRIGGLLMKNVPPKDRDIAMVFQNYALYPHMTVYENLAFGLKLRRIPKGEIARRVEETSRLLGIEKLLDRKPRELSGGQRQRVAMGRAIVREPKVFLMDEPLSNLDAKLRVQMRAELQKLHRRLGITTIYVTHDQVEAMTLGSRIVAMHDGAIQQVDTPRNLYEHPVNLLVAGFIGSPSMNLLPVRIAEDPSGFFFQGRRFRVPVPRMWAKNLGRLKGEEVMLGIRPEAIEDKAFASFASPDNILSARVEAFEPVGPEVYLHLQVGEEMLVARVHPNTRAKAGESLEVALDLTRIHLFESQGGKAISP